jgi:hypothetical protein
LNPLWGIAKDAIQLGKEAGRLGGWKEKFGTQMNTDIEDYLES